mgnify:CR=1 FL=1
MSSREISTSPGDASRSPRLAASVHVLGSQKREAGSALASVLLVLALGLATTAVLVLLTSAEVRLAASDRDAVEARYAAESALDRALVDLQAIASWDDVLSGGVGSSFGVGPPSLTVSSATIDLEAERQAMQARTDASSAAGGNTPRWRLFGWGRLDEVLPPTVASQSPMAVAVWVADDEAEADGASEQDTNQTLWVRAVAYAGHGGRRVIEGLVMRSGPAPAPLRRLIWREAAGG